MSATKTAVLPLVLKYLRAQGLDSTAKKLMKEAKLDRSASSASGDLIAIYDAFAKSKAEAKAAKPVAKKAAAAAAAASSSSSSSSSDSDSDEDTDAAKSKPVAAPVAKKVVAKADSSSSSSSSSDSDDEAPAAKKVVAAPVAKKAAKADSSSSSSSSSDSDDEAPAAKKVVAKPVAKKAAKADSSSSSSSSSDSDSDDEATKAPVAKVAAKAVPAKKAASSSSSSSSDSDSSDDEAPKAPAAKKVAVVAAPVVKKVAKADSSSSSSSSSDSDSDDEDVKMKDAPVAVVKAVAAKADSSSSSSDSDSDDDMVFHKRKREDDSVASTPSKSAKTEATSTPASSVGNPNVVRVSGMPYETTLPDIIKFFAACGAVKETDIDMPLWEDSGRSKGFANITFGDAGAAQACIAMNGATMGERWLKIENYTEKPKRTYDNTPSAKPDGCICVFVGNLSYDIDEAAIKEAFKSCGEVTNVRWGMDRETGDFKGFGHIEFADTASTDLAVAMAGEMVLGRAIRVDYAKGSNKSKSPGGGRKDERGYGPSSEKPPGCTTIFIGNLSFSIDEDSVWTKFGEAGEVVRVKLATDRETGEYRGFGHVEFSSTEAVDKAVKEIAGQKIAGREVRIDYAKGRD